MVMPISTCYNGPILWRPCPKDNCSSVLRNTSCLFTFGNCLFNWFMPNSILGLVWFQRTGSSVTPWFPFFFSSFGLICLKVPPIFWLWLPTAFSVHLLCSSMHGEIYAHPLGATASAQLPKLHAPHLNLVQHHCPPPCHLVNQKMWQSLSYTLHFCMWCLSHCCPQNWQAFCNSVVHVFLICIN